MLRAISGELTRFEGSPKDPERWRHIQLGAALSGVEENRMLRHLRALALLVSFHASFATPAHAEDRSQVGPATVARAARPLGGPWAETAIGLGVLVMAVPLAGFAQLAAGPPWFACWDEEGAADDRCERRAHAQERRASRIGVGVGISVASVGVGLISHGAYRVRRIRHARSALASVRPIISGSSQELALGATFLF